MAEFSSDKLRILPTSTPVSIQRCNGLDVPSTYRSFGQEKRLISRPQYVYIDHPDPPYKEAIVKSDVFERVFLYQKNSTYLLVTCVAFIVGFIFGAMFPFILEIHRVPVLVSSKEVSDKEEISLNRDDLVFRNITHLTNLSEVNNNEIDGIYWSEIVEGLVPGGFVIEDGFRLEEFVQKSAVVRIEEGCGRMQNRLLTFQDGKKACCRYRQNTDQIQGEIFSYRLGRALNLQNLVPSVLVVVNSSAPLWQPVKERLKESQWLNDHLVVLTEFVEDLVPARIPQALRNFASQVLDTDDLQRPNKRNNLFETVFKSHDRNKFMSIDVQSMNKEDLIEMAQWSDMIIFDYLTANLDRIVNNLYNLQWNPEMLSSPAHNLARVSSSNLLVFLDNESGLLHGYRLLDKYEPFHRLLMDALCVFRRPTIQALRSLRSQSTLASLLRPGDLLPALPDRNIHVLSQRVEHVLNQVNSCSQRITHD